MKRPPKVSLEIASDSFSPKYQLKNVYTINNLNLPTQTFSKSAFNHMELVPISDYSNARPTILIGLDAVHLSVTTQLFKPNTTSLLQPKLSLDGWHMAQSKIVLMPNQEFYKFD